MSADPAAILSLDDVYAALREVGAPLPNRDDMDRLYQGRMAEVLRFAASNVQGRKNTASARRSIHALRAQPRTAGTLSEPGADPLYARVQRGESRVKNAQRAIERSEEESQKPSSSLAQLESEASCLQEGLQDKRLTALLLSVLERKETIRKQRFDEISRLLQELRSRVAEQPTTKVQSDSSCLLETISGKPPRTEYTCDTLASLQAHSLRLARLSAVAKGKALMTQTQKSELRLLEVVARSMGSDTENPDVVSAYERVRAAARTHASSSMAYRPPLPEDETEEDLEGIYQRIADKETDLQNLTDQAAALTLACARALQADSVFVRNTAPQLKEALQEETAATQGHVDALRRSVVNRPRAADATGRSQGNDLSHGRSFSQTLSDIEHGLSKTRETESFLNQANALIASDPTVVESHATIAAVYTGEEAAVSSRVQRLLERKSAKADAGRALVQDIERLVAEVGIIASTYP
ncbi:hypothetical protein C2E23DRAFT_831526 [Lenzites betulinus]|nr:hypothetical protein C2E23DRAFT_831526 [Lenzites betulinus]